MSINKNVIPYVFILLLFNACTDIEDVPIITPPNNSANTLFIVDKNATAETRALLSNLEDSSKDLCLVIMMIYGMVEHGTMSRIDLILKMCVATILLCSALILPKLWMTDI